MRIALAIEHFHANVGGAEGMGVAVARELAQHGHGVRVWAEDGRADPSVELCTGPLGRAPGEAAAWPAE